VLLSGDDISRLTAAYRKRTTKKGPHKCTRCPHVCPGCGKVVEVGTDTPSGRDNSRRRNYIARPVFCGKQSCLTKRIREGWERRGCSVEFGTALYDRDGDLIRVYPEERTYKKFRQPRIPVPAGGHKAVVIRNVTFPNGKKYRFSK